MLLKRACARLHVDCSLKGTDTSGLQKGGSKSEKERERKPVFVTKSTFIAQLSVPGVKPVS